MQAHKHWKGMKYIFCALEEANIGKGAFCWALDRTETFRDCTSLCTQEVSENNMSPWSCMSHTLLELVYQRRSLAGYQHLAQVYVRNPHKHRASTETQADLPFNTSRHAHAWHITATEQLLIRSCNGMVLLSCSAAPLHTGGVQEQHMHVVILCHIQTQVLCTSNKAWLIAKNESPPSQGKCMLGTLLD